MKIKYTWQHMHGDADHYDNQELILTDEDEIALFDYVTTQIKFKSRMMEGFLPTDEQLPTLVSLIRNVEAHYDDWLTPNFEEFKNVLVDDFDGDVEKEYKEAVLSDLSEIMCDWKYDVSDVTCSYMHYAKIQDFKREDITNVISTDELLQFIIDKYKLNKSELEQEYLKEVNKNV